MARTGTETPQLSYLRTHWAHQLGFVLALEEVHNERVIPHLVPLPGLLSYNLQGERP